MEIEEKIKELFESGKTKPYQIAKELQIDTKDVRKHLREMTEEGKIDNSGTVKRIQKRQEEVEKLLKDDKRAKEIAKILDVSTYTIREDIKHLKARGKVQSIQEENTHKKSEQEESKEESNQNRIIELYEADKTQKEIAEILGISINKLKKTLENLLAEGKIESKHEIRKKQIRTLCEAGKTQEKIAEILKISPTTVSRYVRELKAEGLDIKKQQRSKKKRKQRKEKIIRKEKAREYMKQCREKLKEGTLKEEELADMKEAVRLVNTYNHAIVYANACIRFGKLQEAIDMLTICSMDNNGEYTKETKEKLLTAISQIENVIRKREATSMLNNGKGVLETAKQTGISVEKILNLQERLKSKGEKNPPIPKERGE